MTAPTPTPDSGEQATNEFLDTVAAALGLTREEARELVSRSLDRAAGRTTNDDERNPA